MSNAALIDIPEEANEALAAFKSDESARAIRLAITNEKLTIEETIKANGKGAEDFDTLADHLKSNEPAFLVVHLERTVAHSEWILIVYIPQACPVRPRTIFASGRAPVQRHLLQIFNGMTDYFVDELKELTYETFLQVTRKDETALSSDEIWAKQEQRESTCNTVLLPTHDEFTWPLADDLMELLRTWASGSGPRIVAGEASNKGEAIAVGGKGDNISDLSSKLPRYCAVRYDNNGTDIKVFILYCPDTCPARQKMMSSTCKHSFLKACTELGVEFEKTFEIRDEPEFTDAHLANLINPTNVDHGYGEVQAFTKARRPGRRA